MRTFFITALTLLLGTVFSAQAQKYPERQEIRKGNKRYDKGDYPGSEVFYLRALEATPGSVEAAGNLAGALYRQERFEEAAQVGAKAARDSMAGPYASQLHYNEGNAQFKQRKFAEAVEAYKNALRKNPDDQQAKFNLAYAQKMLEQDKNGGGGGGGDQDKDQDKDKDQNQDQNQNDKDQNKDQDKQDQNSEPKPDQGEPKPGEGQPQGGISPQEAERMLDAMQGAEDNTKQKVDAQKAKAVGRSGKNW